MVRTERGELPQGFTWKQCKGANLLVPMPQAWFFMPISVHGQFAYGFTPYSITAHGQFETGLMINVYPHMFRGRQIPDVRTIQDAALAVPGFRKTDEGEYLEDDKFATFRMHVESDARRIGPIQFTDQAIYLENTINRRTGTLYTFEFHTTASKWNEYKDIADTMIQKRVLNPNT